MSKTTKTRRSVRTDEETHHELERLATRIGLKTVNGAKHRYGGILQMLSENPQILFDKLDAAKKKEKEFIERFTSPFGPDPLGDVEQQLQDLNQPVEPQTTPKNFSINSAFAELRKTWGFAKPKPIGGSAWVTFARGRASRVASGIYLLALDADKLELLEGDLGSVPREWFGFFITDEIEKKLNENKIFLVEFVLKKEG